MKAAVRSAILATSGLLAPAQIGHLLSLSLRERKLAICLHRVAQRRRPNELLPEFTIEADDLDALIELLLSTRGATERWLTVSFDDGYLDSAEYILSRAPRYPLVEWLYFVCPEKVERQAGFRWDAAELRLGRGEQVDLEAFLAERHERENERAELLALARRPEFALADVETCRKVAALPNAALGNHTDWHTRATRVPLERFAEELAASTERFERLFGPQEHFAFPFGVPGEDFWMEHVDAVRALRPCLIWSTERRPYSTHERTPGSLLPRMVVDGRPSVQAMATWIALNAARSRLLKPAPLRMSA